MGGNVGRSNSDLTEKKKSKEKSNFEFCKVCNLNHDQGQKHKYFPSHKKLLSSYLSRFQSKLDDVLFFLKNPAPLRPEHASHNRLWCIFCDIDVMELDSSFACGNAIIHLSSADHLKNLKHFVWKYGCGMDQLDKFSLSDADAAKWKKKCEALKQEAASSGVGSCGAFSGHSHDIHNEPNSGIVEPINDTTVYAVHSNILNTVMPLQYNTDENQTAFLGKVGVASIGDSPSNLTSTAPVDKFCHTFDKMTAGRRIQHSLTCGGTNISTIDAVKSNQVHTNDRLVTRESRILGWQNFTQVFPMVQKEVQGNVHSGAAPPWLDPSEQSQIDSNQKPSVSFVSFHNKSKSRKLNPTRVGAAWAEKRKRELELERRGEIINSDGDTNWLPNFGRVWQSGSRKESRKEFQMEKQKVLNVETQCEMIELQPYISKRMRKNGTE